MTTSTSTSTQYYHSRFPGEDFLAADIVADLPDYESERHRIVRDVVVAVVLFIFVLPYFFAVKRRTKTTTSSSSSSKVTATTSTKNDSEDSGTVWDSNSSSGTLEHGQRQEPPRTTDRPTRASSSNKKRNGRKEKRHRPTTTTTMTGGDSSASASAVATTTTADADDVVVEFSSSASSLLTLLCVIAILSVLFFADNNLYGARSVLLVPVFTREECRYLIDVANAAAYRNAERAREEREALMLERPKFMELGIAKGEEEEGDDGKKDATTTDANDSNDTNANDDPHALRWEKLESTLREPSGWTKDRHDYHPTTDLNLVTDPFAPDDRAWLAERLTGRLAPAVERAFGIFRGAIRANDIFVVRYDATQGQPSLRRHTDSSHLSFNILLNDEFEGGGTRFHSRNDGSHFDVHPEVGEALVSHANILHEGLATTRGTRYILVGFDSVDERDPLTGEKTNLSIFSSWLNFSWMQIRFKEGFQDGRKSRSRILNNNDIGGGGGGDLTGEWQYSRYAVSLFRDLDFAMTMLIDRFAKFRIVKLVDTKDFGSYFRAMDEASQRRRKETDADELGTNDAPPPSRGDGHPSWFRGQQIDLDVFGNLKSIWDSRKGKEDKFRGEYL